jgi:amino acid adenylation domain-containing protein
MTIQTELIKSFQVNHDRIAVEQNGQKITYATLFGKANAVTAGLVREQLEKETIVGVCLKDRADLIAAMIGVMNARCVFVLLDPTLPENRLKAMAETLHLEHIILADTRSVIPGMAINTMKVYSFESMMSEKLGDWAYPAFDGNDSLYIYFTSGSTGVPKGIIGKNSSLLKFVEWEISTFELDGDTRVSQLISPYFDAFLRDVFTPLMAGGAICVPPGQESFFSAANMIAWIDQSAISLIHCVPSVFRVFNDQMLTTGHFKSLRYILLSAEKIIPAELTNWYQVFGPRIQLVNLYGTTETTMVSSFHKIVPEDVTKPRIPIGAAIGHARLLVANSDLTPCQPLVTGDLYIISRYTTKGYLNNPELTREKFLVLNAGTPDEEIAYKTGDKARVLANHEIELIGREDRQIKLRGQRIELDEIERILVQNEWVKNAVVVKHTEDNGDEALVGYFIKSDPLENNKQLPDMIHQFLEQHLPKYMIPSAIIEVNDFPLLSNGKIDLKKLMTSSLVAAKTAEPVDEITEKLMLIWKEIIGDKPIDTEASFHRMGGNSLSIMKLIGKIYKEFNVRISLGELFDNLTIKKQAAFIKRSGKDRLYIIAKAPAKKAYHVSSAQERMYFSYELNRQSTSYNMPVAWEIKGAFDQQKVAQAFRLLIERHEALRTVFGLEDGQLVQMIKEQVEFQIEEINGVQVGNEHQAIVDFIRPFDLTTGPLFRCGIVHIDGGNKMLVVDFHHIICDGVSQTILFADFLSFYNEVTPAPLSLQYKDYAEWEHQFKSTEEYITHREFWLRSFEGEIPRLDLPTVEVAGEEGTEKGGNIVFEIPRQTLQPLFAFLEKEELTIFPGLFSLYYMFLLQLTGQEDMVVGVPASGRMQQELDKVVGMFVKMMPIRYQVDVSLPFSEFVKNVGKYLIQANSKQIYDLTNIVSEVNKNRVSPIESLYDVVFGFHNYEITRIKGDEALAVYEIDQPGAKIPITLLASEYNNIFKFRLQYSQAYFTRADATLLVTQFQALAEAFGQNPAARIVDVVGSGALSNEVVEDDISFNL